MQAERREGHRPIDFTGMPRDGAELVRATADVRAALREAAIATAEAAARARSLAELLDEALVVLTDEETTPTLGPTPLEGSQREADALSPREREVLALVAEGRTNKAIAAALFVSPNTVKTHVTSLLHKLRVDTRVQLAAIATKQGLHSRAAIGVAIERVSI